MRDVAEATTRASLLLSQVESLPSIKMTSSARLRLAKLIRSEIRFLQSLSSHTHAASLINCTNLGYYEAVVRLLRNPHIDGVSAVFQVFTVSDSREPDCHCDDKPIEVHVDIVCTFQAKPVWIIVSDRNPKHCYWNVEGNGVNWQSRVSLLINKAQSLTLLKPVSILFCFARGVSDSLYRGFELIGASQIALFKEELPTAHGKENILTEIGDISFEVDEYDWVSINVCRDQLDKNTSSESSGRIPDRSYCHWTTFKVDTSPIIDKLKHGHSVIKSITEHLPAQGPMFTLSNVMHMSKDNEVNSSSPVETHRNADQAFLSFLSVLSQQKRLCDIDENLINVPNLVNLDTTALIALVSEISNGAAKMLINMGNEDMVSKFKSTAQFMRDQAEDELTNPLLQQVRKLLENKRPFISESVCVEFQSLVSLCGGFKEKQRAKELLKLLPVVPDTPSSRVLKLPETGKIKKKNKVIFGTGDWWQAPTLTANMSFVRAVRQTGMALSVLEHQPRALMGEKCTS